MKSTLKAFINGSLFESTALLLNKLNIYFDPETAKPIPVSSLYEDEMPQYLINALESIENTYFIGVINNQSLTEKTTKDTLEDVAEITQRDKTYNGMIVFACDAKKDANLSRTEISALTRAFNKIARSNPVILVIRQGKYLSMATCERTCYSQKWRNKTGEKLGNVSILLNIDCVDPHRAHIDILESLGEKKFSSFNDLYSHWMSVFSTEVLTQKFYAELSNWYAWATKEIQFPNNIANHDDDERLNNEGAIRLITRLIFVWFLKQIHLIPEEFFDESYIKENFIEEFNPHAKNEESHKSLYYKCILQNLFFAMLNCPIKNVDDATGNIRHFVENDDEPNNLLRFKQWFKNSTKFLDFANSNVPYLNSGLFDCLDFPEKDIYYDGFSEDKQISNSVIVPDYLFFGKEVGNSLDLSDWYEDDTKKSVSVRGLIEILSHYNFTVEEKTPEEQEVSLDPELLGNVFENLLASYNPETKITARKQTGSFFTKKEIVDKITYESLVGYLINQCGIEHEQLYKDLLNDEKTVDKISEDLSKEISRAIYNCKIIDPACGSGAFPMGILQKMVYILQQVDTGNQYWKELIIEDICKYTKQIYSSQDSKTRKQELSEIDQNFDEVICTPNYSRKLYIIEHCIQGVDIQPIAILICKLRFFISLITDIKPTDKADQNFGIHPLPNLDTRFIAANTLISLNKDYHIWSNNSPLRDNERKLDYYRHVAFYAKSSEQKKTLQQCIMSTIRELAQEYEKEGLITNDISIKMSQWDCFDQYHHANFFDPELMFGNRCGFNIVISNPPYIEVKNYNSNWPGVSEYIKGHYPCSQSGKVDFCIPFIERGIELLGKKGILNYLTQRRFFKSDYGELLRKKIYTDNLLYKVYEYLSTDLFNGKTTYVAYLALAKGNGRAKFQYGNSDSLQEISLPMECANTPTWTFRNNVLNGIISDLSLKWGTLGDAFKVKVGLQVLWKDAYHINVTEIANGLIYGSTRIDSKVVIEEDACRPLVKNDAFISFATYKSDLYTLFPYEIDITTLEIKRIKFKDYCKKYPRAGAYLKAHKNLICKKVQIMSSLHPDKFNEDDHWHLFTREQNLNTVEPKVVIPMTSIYPKATVIGKFGYYCDNSNVNFISINNDEDNILKYALSGIVNSSLFGIMAKNMAIELRGGYSKYNKQYISVVPFPSKQFAISNDLIVKIAKISKEMEDVCNNIKKGNTDLSWEDLRIQKYNTLNEEVNRLYEIDDVTLKAIMIEHE